MMFRPLPWRVSVTRGDDVMAARLLAEADARDAGVRVKIGDTRQEGGRWVFDVTDFVEANDERKRRK